MNRKKTIWILRWFGVGLLTLVALTFWFREELRDFSVDDTRFSKEIRFAARRHGLDPQLVRAVVFQESRFDPFARGRAGEVGLMQVLPSGAAAEWGRLNRRKAPDVNALHDPAVNLDIGCWYLSRGIEKYRKYAQGTEMALAWYNAGESRVNRWKPEDPDGEFVGRIDISSTTAYVKKIMARYRKYLETAAEYSDSAGK